MAREVVKNRNKGTAGSRSRHLYFQCMLEAIYGRTLVQHTLALGDLYWESFIERMELRPWALPFLKGMQEDGCLVALVTNLGASIQYKKLIHLSISEYIDFLVTSEEAGCEKPDPKIFFVALEKMGVKAEDSVMVGDHEHEDGAGARRAGIPFLLCNS